MLKWHLPEAEGTAAVTDCLPTSESYETLHAPLPQTKGIADDPTVFLLIFRDRIWVIDSGAHSKFFLAFGEIINQQTHSTKSMQEVTHYKIVKTDQQKHCIVS